MATVFILSPGLGGVGTTLGVPLGEIFEDSGLLDVLLVSGLLLGSLVGADLIELSGSQSVGNIGGSGLDFTDLELSLPIEKRRATCEPKAIKQSLCVHGVIPSLTFFLFRAP